MSAHTYWRLDLSSGSSGSEFAEIEMRTSIGGSNACSGGTPTASSTFSSNVASNALDSNTGTIWESNGTGAQWWKYQFASGVDIAEIKVVFGSHVNELPVSIGLSYSDDDSSWTVAMPPKKTDPFVTNGVMLLQVGTSDTNSYWRLNCSVGRDANYLAIAEIAMHTSIGGSNACSGGGNNIAWDSAFSVAYGSLAFDGLNATQWESNTGFPHWIYYRFPSDTAIVEYVVTAGTSNGEAPKTWTFEYSGDGLTWTTADTQTNAAAWSINEVRTFSIGATNVALTGNAGTSAVGSQGVGHTCAITGNAASAAVGTVARVTALTGNAASAAVGNASPPLPGNACAVSVGTMTTGIAKAITGNAASAAVGTVARVTALTGNAASAAVGAVAQTNTAIGDVGTVAIGTVGVAINKGLVGNAAPAAAGAVVQGSSLTGNAASTAVGAVAQTNTPNGVAATVAIGIISVSVSIQLTGNAVVSAVGAVSSGIIRGASGVLVTGMAGTAVSVNYLSGVQSTGALGGIAPGATLTGVGGTASTGTVTCTRSVGLSGVSAIPNVGNTYAGFAVAPAAIAVTTYVGNLLTACGITGAGSTGAVGVMVGSTDRLLSGTGAVGSVGYTIPSHLDEFESSGGEVFVTNAKDEIFVLLSQ